VTQSPTKTKYDNCTKFWPLGNTEWWFISQIDITPSTLFRTIGTDPSKFPSSRLTIEITNKISPAMVAELEQYREAYFDIDADKESVLKAFYETYGFSLWRFVKLMSTYLTPKAAPNDLPEGWTNSGQSLKYSKPIISDGFASGHVICEGAGSLEMKDAEVLYDNWLGGDGSAVYKVQLGAYGIPRDTPWNVRYKAAGNFDDEPFNQSHFAVRCGTLLSYLSATEPVEKLIDRAQLPTIAVA